MMERLTGYNSFGGAYAVGMGCNEYHNNEEIIHKVIERLAAYEDTGLEPGELQEMLNEAYDVGVDSVLRDHFDTPWDEAADLRKNIDRLRELAQADKDGRVVVLPCKVGDTLWTYANYPAKHIYPFQICAIQLMEKTMSTTCVGRIKWSDIGKTVFLTREEAEAALKEGGE